MKLPINLPWKKGEGRKAEEAAPVAVVQKKPLVTSGMLPFIGIMPGVALAIAVGATVFAGTQINQVVHKKKAEVNYVVSKTPLGGTELDNVAARLTQLNPSLSFKSEAGKLFIQAKAVSSYAEFVYALNTLPGIEKQVAWEMSSLCINDCRNQVGMEAILSGYRQKVRVEDGQGQSDEPAPGGLAPLAPLK